MLLQKPAVTKEREWKQSKVENKRGAETYNDNAATDNSTVVT